MLRTIEVLAVTIQRIVRQMNVRIVVAFRGIVLLACKPDETILVEEDAHWRNNGGDQYIDSKIVLMP